MRTAEQIRNYQSAQEKYRDIFEKAINKGLSLNRHFGIINLFYVMNDTDAYDSVINEYKQTGYFFTSCEEELTKEYFTANGMTVFIKINW